MSQSRPRIRVRTPSRLHFGLLAWGPHAPRQFGGVGLMIDSPALELTAEPTSGGPGRGHAEGPLAGRAQELATSLAERLAHQGIVLPAYHLRIERAPAEHVGLGVGTQLSLAVTRALLTVAQRPCPPIAEMAALTGRGQRSGIGLHGFLHGGLIVDGGRRDPTGIPPLLARVAFPADWAILVVQPLRLTGLHGSAETRAFADLPPIPDTVTDRLCRLVLLGLLPALQEHDLSSFGAALTELQQQVGQCFAAAQGGIYARPELEAIVTELRAQRLHGVGQSSWGPTLYAFSNDPVEQRGRIVERIRTRFGLPPEALFWTAASPQGHVMEAVES